MPPDRYVAAPRIDATRAPFGATACRKCRGSPTSRIRLRSRVRAVVDFSRSGFVAAHSKSELHLCGLWVYGYSRHANSLGRNETARQMCWNFYTFGSRRTIPLVIPLVYDVDMNAHRKPTVGFLVAVSLLMPILYVLSFGPACWIAERVDSRVVYAAVSTAYRPIAWIANRSTRASAAALWYVGLGVRSGTTVAFDGDRIDWWTDVGGPGSVKTYDVSIEMTISGDGDDSMTEGSTDND